MLELTEPQERQELLEMMAQQALLVQLGIKVQLGLQE
jgi:hypothetical protein